MRQGIEARVVSRAINRVSLAFIDRGQGQAFMVAALAANRKDAA